MQYFQKNVDLTRLPKIVKIPPNYSLSFKRDILKYLNLKEGKIVSSVDKSSARLKRREGK